MRSIPSLITRLLLPIAILNFGCKKKETPSEPSPDPSPNGPVVKAITYTSASVSVEVSGSIMVNSSPPSEEDPVAGVAVFATTNSQDGSAYEMRVLQGTTNWNATPDRWNFNSNSNTHTLYAFVVTDLRAPEANGKYSLKVNGVQYSITTANVLYLTELSQVRRINYSGSNVIVEVSDSIMVNSSPPSEEDPVAGVAVFATTNGQDGSAYELRILTGTDHWHSTPSQWAFTSNRGTNTLYAFVVTDIHAPEINGRYKVKVNGTTYLLDANNVVYLSDYLQ
jgi:hypothetical protein